MLIVEPPDQDWCATAPSINTSMCNTLVMTFFTNKKDATWTPPTGTTEVYDAPNNQNGLTSNMMAYYVKAEEGSTGNKAATASIADSWVAQQIAIRPGHKQIRIHLREEPMRQIEGNSFEEVPLSEESTS